MLDRCQARAQSHERVLNHVLSGVVIMREQPREPDRPRVGVAVELREVVVHPSGNRARDFDAAYYHTSETSVATVPLHSTGKSVVDTAQRTSPGACRRNRSLTPY